MTRENPPVANESAETPKENKRKFNFGHEMDQFIEEKTQGNLTYFKGILNKALWESFVGFIKRKSRIDPDRYDHEVINALEEGEETYFNSLNYKVIKILSYNQNLIDRAKRVFELDIDDLTADEKNELEKKLIESNSKELYSLIWSENLRNKFIQKHIITIPADFNRRKKVNVDRANIIFDKIFGAEPAFLARLKNINDHSFDELRESIFRFSDSAIRVRIDDIETILSQVPDNLKASLIKFFVPSITLQKAVDLGLKTKEEAEEVVITNLSRLGIELANDVGPIQEKDLNDFKKLISSFELDKFYIDTDTLNQDQIKNIGNNSENLRKITEQVNEGKDKIDAIFTREDFLKRVEDSDKISKNLKLKSPTHFVAGNYLEIGITDKKGITKTDYFYIKSINAMSVTLVNVTKNTGVSATNDGDTEEVPFGDLFETFEIFSKGTGSKIDLLNPIELFDEKKVDKVSEEAKITTTKELNSTLNEYDKDGKGVDINKLAFTVKPKPGEKSEIYDDIFYYALEVTDTKIVLNNGEVFEVGTGLDLSDFASIFKERGGKRFSKLNTRDEFLQAYSDKNEEFKKLDLIFDKEDGLLKPKKDEGKTEHNGKEYKGIEYFINEKGKESIHIDEFGENIVSFTIGDLKEDEEKGKKTFEGDKKKAVNFTYTQFFMYIKNKKLKPHSENEEIIEDPQHNEHAKHFHNHWFEPIAFWKKNFSSVGQLSAAFKHIGHTISHNIEANDDLKSAKLAKMLGKFIPSAHIQGELQADMEKKEKETVYKLKDHLQGVDSKDMIKQVIHILENKFSTRYEIEAAMFAVLKYGTLYPKGALFAYRGSNIWFKRLGGKEKDIPNMIKEIRKNMPGVIITEEVLVQQLLTIQSKADGNNVRSKLYKEFGKELKAGIGAETEDGKRESSERMTLDGRINYAMGEFEGGTFAHGIACMENIENKGPDPAWNVNTIPFVIMAGGVTKHTDQDLTNKVKGKGFTTPYHQLFLAGSIEEIDKYSDYVARCIELSQNDGNKSKMYVDFKEISKKSNSYRVKEAFNFWKKYGKELYPIINMTDGFVVAKKDDPGNEALKFYYDKVSGCHNSVNDFKPTDKIDNGFFDASNGPVISDIMLKKITLDDGGVLDDDKAPKKILDSYLDYLKTNVLKNPKLSESEKKKVFFDVYSKLERHIYEKLKFHKYPENPTEDWYKDLGAYNDLAKKGFGLYNKSPVSKTQEGLDEFIKTDGYKEFLEEQYNNVKSGINNSSGAIGAQINHVKSSVGSLLNQSRVNNKPTN